MIRLIQLKNNSTPITIIKTPPAFIMKSWFFLIHFSFVIKKDNKRNGTAKPSTYNIMYGTAEPGLVPASVITAANIGPVHGVHPAANAIPIKTDPKNPLGLCLKWILRSFIIASGRNTPSVMKPNKIISNAPICRIAS